MFKTNSKPEWLCIFICLRCEGLRREGRRDKGEKMQIDRGEESSPLLPGLFLARLTGGQQLASALHAETQHRVLSLSPLVAHFNSAARKAKSQFHLSSFPLFSFSLLLFSKLPLSSSSPPCFIYSQSLSLG